MKEWSRRRCWSWRRDGVNAEAELYIEVGGRGVKMQVKVKAEVESEV